MELMSLKPDNHKKNDMDIPDDQFDEVIYLDNLSLTETGPKVLAEKVTGDRVTFLDFSVICHDTGAELTDEELNSLNLNDEFIVIATHQEHLTKATFFKHTQDLIVFHAHSGKKYRTASYITRLVY
jgi:hypothetical protein